MISTRGLFAADACLIQQLRFGHHGCSPHRLAKLAAQECRCHRKFCFQKLQDMKEHLMQFLKTFWALSKHVQDEYLKLTSKGGLDNPDKTRKTWFFLGKRMGPKCCLALLGVGNSRFSRVEQGKFDRRYSVWGGVSR